MQNSIAYSVKYDEFPDGNLRILEVDASSEQERSSFSPSDFPEGEPEEVTGDARYYGYRVADLV
ncbi:MAG TPA: hypothetical protein VLG36_01980 [Candidatus Chromulinivoraceae bacterium]|nr:hypothetical protein [Candidatus Chromulinivoraceae bacterium]